MASSNTSAPLSEGVHTGELPQDGGLSDTSRALLEERVQDLEEKLQLAHLKLRGIEAISRSLVSEHNLERILEEVMDRTTELLSAERATLYLLTDDKKRMWSKVLQGEELKQIELDVGQGIAGWVALHGKSVNVKDAYRDPRFDPSTDQRSGFRTRSILCQPLVNAQKGVIGVIQVLNKKGGYFTPADEHLLTAIASQAAITIQNSKLYLDIIGKNIDLLETQLRLRERTAEIELLFAIERAAATAITQDGALDGILETTMKEWPCEVGGIILVDPHRDVVRYSNLQGREAHRLAGAELDLGEGAVGLALSSGESVSYANRPGDDDEAEPVLTVHESHIDPSWEIRSLVAVPIIHKGERLGCLQLINRIDDPRGWDEDELRVLESIGSRISLSMQLARALEEEQKAERLATIGQMLSGVMHDVKTPLTIISGYARLMAREDERDTRAEYRELIAKQITQLKSMTQELLAFARGETQVLLRKVFIQSFIGEINEVLQEEFAGSGVTLVVQTTYRGAVRMDDSKMKRVVFNLARNAREAMQSGGGGTFTIAVEEVDGQVVFIFSDTGPGIPPERLPTLFDPFVTFGKKNGTGLGLAIVDKIVSEHHGSITVDSTVGVGTTFTIKLPTQS